MSLAPFTARIIIPIKERDEQFMKIQQLIGAKERLLYEKQKKLRFISKQNCFLKTVNDDYRKYYIYINQQKHDQIKALEMLDEYIKELRISGKLTKHNLEDAKEEQRKILNEIKIIKDNLDSIIENTETIRTELNNSENNNTIKQI
jgi:hypothetical protein